MSPRNIVLIGAAVLIVLGGAFTLLSNRNADSTMQKGDVAMEQGSEMMESKDATATEKNSGTMTAQDEAGAKPTGEMMMQAGSYEPYGPEKIAKATTGNVVLFFKASWCPTCRAVHADIQSHLKDIPSNLTILDLDYDNSAALKQKYGVVYQHTFVQVDAQGNSIKKWSGSPTLAALVAQVK